MGGLWLCLLPMRYLRGPLDPVPSTGRREKVGDYLFPWGIVAEAAILGGILLRSSYAGRCTPDAAVFSPQEGSTATVEEDRSSWV